MSTDVFLRGVGHGSLAGRGWLALDDSRAPDVPSSTLGDGEAAAVGSQALSGDPLILTQYWCVVEAAPAEVCVCVSYVRCRWLWGGGVARFCEGCSC